jgi:hypothetical protein
VTPSGIEAGPNVTESRRRTGTPTEPGALERPAATFECNECNEAVAGAREVIGVARRLAMVVRSAVANGDSRHTLDVLDRLQSVLASNAGVSRLGGAAATRSTIASHAKGGDP